MNKQTKTQQKTEPEQIQAKAINKEMGLETAVSTPHIPILQRALADPSDITPNDARALQRTIGNQAVRRLVVQRKMTVGPVGDKYEQEADVVAKQVMQTINTPRTPPVQRQEKDDELQMKPFSPTTLPPVISTLQRQEEDDELQMKSQSMMDGGDLSSDIESQIQSAKGGGASIISPCVPS